MRRTQSPRSGEWATRGAREEGGRGPARPHRQLLGQGGFALYAAIAIIAAIALTAVFSVVASLVAESTVEEDSDAYSGTFVFDEASTSLVPAEMLSWYEVPAFESLYGQDGTEAPEGESAETGAVILYVEGSARADSKLCFVNSF